MDQLQQRTLFKGLIMGFALYALGFVFPFLVRPPYGNWIGMGLTLAALVFVLVWFLAVKRGFRMGTATRQGKRLETRGKARKPLRPRF